jgi:hypothetical protein
MPMYRTKKGFLFYKKHFGNIAPDVKVLERSLSCTHQAQLPLNGYD